MKVGLLGLIKVQHIRVGRKSHLKRRSSDASVSVGCQKQTFYELPGSHMNVVALRKHQRLVSLHIQAYISLFRDCFRYLAKCKNFAFVTMHLQVHFSRLECNFISQWSLVPFENVHEKRGGLLFPIARKKNLISVRSSAQFCYHFCIHLGPSPQISCRPLFCLTIPILINDQFVLPLRFRDFKNKGGNKMGLQMSQKISPDLVITSDRPRYYSLLLSQAKNFQISIRLRYILEVFVVTYLRFSQCSSLLRFLPVPAKRSQLFETLRGP